MLEPNAQQKKLEENHWSSKLLNLLNGLDFYCVCSNLDFSQKNFIEEFVTKLNNTIIDFDIQTIVIYEAVGRGKFIEHLVIYKENKNV